MGASVKTAEVNKAGGRGIVRGWRGRLRRGDEVAHLATFTFAAAILALTLLLGFELYRSSHLTIKEFGWSFFTSSQWKANHFYFEDPDRNILEILGTTAGEAVAALWARVGEVGLPVPNLRQFINQIAHVIPTELPGESETFQFYGNAHGVLVLVKESRPWFPTDRGATAHDIEVVFEGEKEGAVQVGPVTIRSIAGA
jgi:hypothetical protein